MTNNKIKKLCKIRTELVNQFPFIDLVIKKYLDKIIVLLYHNKTKNTLTNNFDKLDGGIKDRITRKIKNSLTKYHIDYLVDKTNKYVFICG